MSFSKQLTTYHEPPTQFRSSPAATIDAAVDSAASNNYFPIDFDGGHHQDIGGDPVGTAGGVVMRSVATDRFQLAGAPAGARPPELLPPLDSLSETSRVTGGPARLRPVPPVTERPSCPLAEEVPRCPRRAALRDLLASGSTLCLADSADGACGPGPARPVRRLVPSARSEASGEQLAPRRSPGLPFKRDRGRLPAHGPSVEEPGPAGSPSGPSERWRGPAG